MSNNRGRARAGNKEQDEVEELLQAAQDEMLLNLSLNSHRSHTSAPLDQDLLRRFQALKSPSVPPKITPVPSLPTQQEKQSSKSTKTVVDDELEKVIGTDLSARFSALKASSSNSSSSSAQVQLPSEGSNRVDDTDDDDDEVEKLLRWAVDAARLDPSKSDDEEDSLIQDETDEEDGSDDDDDDDDRKPKPKPRK